MIVNATLSNNRVGIAVILDAASVAGSYVDPDVRFFVQHLLLSLISGYFVMITVILIDVFFLCRLFSQL